MPDVRYGEVTIMFFGLKSSIKTDTYRYCDASLRLKASTIQWLVQLLVQASNKEYFKDPHHWSLVDSPHKVPVMRKASISWHRDIKINIYKLTLIFVFNNITHCLFVASNAESVSMSWRHYVWQFQDCFHQRRVTIMDTPRLPETEV